MGATLAGFLAIIMWALLALLTDLSGQVPPFQLSALAFSIATLVGLVFGAFSAKSSERKPDRKSVV